MKLIATADWHLRDKKPRCVVGTEEEWIDAQLDQVEFILAQCVVHKATLIIAGDVFHFPLDNSFNLLGRLLELFHFYSDVPVCVIPGNHDLPYHSLENIGKSTYNTFVLGLKNKTVPEGMLCLPFGKSVENAPNCSILTHQPVFASKDDIFIGMKAKTASELLFEYREARLIITGDIHHGFLFRQKDRLLVNPGCLNIQSASMIDYTPSCYVIDYETLEIGQILIPQKTIVSDEYLRIEQGREDRILAFVEGLQKGGEISLNFAENVKARLAGSELSDTAKKLVSELLGGAV